jgi:hypothetical protein
MSDKPNPAGEHASGGACPECGATFDGGKDLQRHVATHAELARASDDTGGTVSMETGGEPADGGAGTVQTE